MKEAFKRCQADAIKSPKLVAAFFFNGRGNEIEKSPYGLIRSLLHQLLQENAIMRTELVEIYRKRCELQGKDWQWTQEELQSFMRSRLVKLGNTRVDIFIDALDECDETQARDVVKYFRDLTSAAFESGTNLNICLSSRHYPNITVEGCPEIFVEEENGHDIEVYVKAHLSCEGDHEVSAPESLLAKEIVEKSSGIFLWAILAARIVREDLDKGRPFDRTRLKLQGIPAELDKIFKQLFENFHADDVAETIAILRWVLLAMRSISVSELRHALLFSVEDPPRSAKECQELERPWIPINRNFIRRILDLSRGLVEVVETTFSSDVKDTLLKEETPWIFTKMLPSKIALSWYASKHLKFVDKDALHKWDCRYFGSLRVQFIHETVREFFMGKGFLLLDPSLDDNPIGMGHCAISRTCHAYLSLAELLVVPETPAIYRQLRRTVGRKSDHYSEHWAPPNYPLLSYASRFCVDHARAAESMNVTSDHFLQNRPTLRHVSMFKFWQRFRSFALEVGDRLKCDEYPSILHFLCDNGLFLTAAKRLNQTTAELNCHGKSLVRYTLYARYNYMTPLFYTLTPAPYKKDEDVARIVRLMIEKGADLNAIVINKPILIKYPRAADVLLSFGVKEITSNDEDEATYLDVEEEVNMTGDSESSDGGQPETRKDKSPKETILRGLLLDRIEKPEERTETAVEINGTAGRAHLFTRLLAVCVIA
jgi:hypothetical protein